MFTSQGTSQYEIANTILKFASLSVVRITVVYVVTDHAVSFVRKLILTICRSAMRAPKLASMSRRSSSFSGQGYTVARYLSLEPRAACHD